MVVRRRVPSIRIIAMAKVISGHVVAPGAADDALFRKGAGPARRDRAMDAMTDLKRSACRLSMENSPGFRALDAIPSHPNNEHPMFPSRREMGFPSAESAIKEIFLVPSTALTQAVCGS